MPQHASIEIRRAEVLTSRENRWLKKFRAALKGAPEDGTIAVEGVHLVQEALRSGLAIEAVLVSAAGERHLGKLSPRLTRAARYLFAVLWRSSVFCFCCFFTSALVILSVSPASAGSELPRCLRPDALYREAPTKNRRRAVRLLHPDDLCRDAYRPAEGASSSPRAARYLFAVLWRSIVFCFYCFFISALVIFSVSPCPCLP